MRSVLIDWDGRRASASTELTDADGYVIARGQQIAMPAPGSHTKGGWPAERLLATVLFTDIVGSTEQAERLGLEVRAGLHTGIAVHIASRVQGLARPGEILVSGTVCDLVTGSGLRFGDRGRHRLKGLDGDWQLHALEA